MKPIIEAGLGSPFVSSSIIQTTPYGYVHGEQIFHPGVFLA